MRAPECEEEVEGWVAGGEGGEGVLRTTHRRKKTKKKQYEEKERRSVSGGRSRRPAPRRGRERELFERAEGEKLTLPSSV